MCPSKSDQGNIVINIPAGTKLLDINDFKNNKKYDIGTDKNGNKVYVTQGIKDNLKLKVGGSSYNLPIMLYRHFAEFKLLQDHHNSQALTYKGLQALQKDFESRYSCFTDDEKLSVINEQMKMLNSSGIDVVNVPSPRLELLEKMQNDVNLTQEQVAHTVKQKIVNKVQRIINNFQNITASRSPQIYNNSIISHSAGRFNTRTSSRTSSRKSPCL